jgi:hypothetical protein
MYKDTEKKEGIINPFVDESSISIEHTENNLLDKAREYLSLGYSIIPTLLSKSPTIPWKKYQGEKITLEALEKVFKGTSVEGIGIICGQISGGLEVIDVDVKNDPLGNIWNDYKKLLEDNIPELFQSLVIATTQNKGYHILYKCSFVDAPLKIAKSIKGVIIETKGEGGYVLAHPTPGYAFIQNDLSNVPTLTPGQREILIGIAKTLNQEVEQDLEEIEYVETKKHTENKTYTGLTSLQDYNNRGDYMGLLLSHGWKRVKEDSERIYLLRPGETTSETSGNFHKGKNCLYLFTTSDAKLDQGKPYSPSQLYNALECGGDWSKTALELGKQGYGDYKPSTPEKETSVEPVGDIIQERKKSLLIDLTEKVPAPQIAISIKNPSNNEDIILGTLGDFSLVIGKAKSRKSFFCSIIAAVALGVNIVLGRLKSHLPEDKRNVLYFDTEQSKYYVQKAMQRICKLADMENPGNLFGYGLRTLDPRERLEIIETLISETPNLGLVVIDGIKDLITSINDEEQSTMIASKLLKWSEVYNIHIVCVLHQNKGDDKARGHIGTELQNKAQTVLSVTKDSEDKNYSIVSAEFCRDKEPEDFVFEIDQEGIPIQSENYIKK